jgi:hypothetical protein
VRWGRTWLRVLGWSSSGVEGDHSVITFRHVRGICLVVSDHNEALPRGVVALGAVVVEVAEPVAAASRNQWNITRSGTLEKSHSAYPCEVAGGSSLAEPW